MWRGGKKDADWKDGGGLVERYYLLLDGSAASMFFRSGLRPLV